MAAVMNQFHVCRFCEESLGPEVPSFKLSSKHEVFHGHDNVKSAYKYLQEWTEPLQDSSFLDEVLKDDDVMCRTCFDKLATIFIGQQQVELAKTAFRMLIGEG